MRPLCNFTPYVTLKLNAFQEFFACNLGVTFHCNIHDEILIGGVKKPRLTANSRVSLSAFHIQLKKGQPKYINDYATQESENYSKSYIFVTKHKDNTYTVNV